MWYEDQPRVAQTTVSLMDHPFADRIGMAVTELSAGHGRCTLTLTPQHLDPYGVAHGAVVFALADTGMRAAPNPTLAAGETCATIEVKINPKFLPSCSHREGVSPRRC